MLASLRKLDCAKEGHDFKPGSLGATCSRCGLVVDSEEIFCRCQKTVGRDKVHLAHVILSQEEKTFQLVTIAGLLCNHCGMNWDILKSYQGDYKAERVDLSELCRSPAELAFYEEYLRPFEDIVRYIPQLFLPIGPKHGYFVDFAQYALVVGFEIDGVSRLLRAADNRMRDKAIKDHYGMTLNRITVKIRDGEFLFEKYPPTRPQPPMGAAANG